MEQTERTARDWPRPVVHWAIHSPDVDRARSFYAGVFGWRIEAGGLASIEPGFGGPEPGPGGHIQAGPPGVSLYVQVRDLRETLDRAVELGGSIEHEPFQFEGQPTLAGIRDPDGTVVMLVQQ